MSTVYTTTIYTVTSCPPTVTNCPVGHVTTETIALYTTYCPYTAPATTSAAASALTTSTVYTTTIYTVSKCPPTVTNCPYGQVTTETIALYTTVCPVAEASAPATATGAPELGYGTSTVYTTTTYTVTKCPPSVQNCPYGHLTTETIPLYTTVYPITPAGPQVTNAGNEELGLTTSTAYSTTIYTVTKCPPTVLNCPYGQLTTESIPLYTTTYKVPGYSNSNVAQVTQVNTVVPVPVVTPSSGAGSYNNPAGSPAGSPVAGGPQGAPQGTGSQPGGPNPSGSSLEGAAGASPSASPYLPSSRASSFGVNSLGIAAAALIMGVIAVI
jgi:hypothetical protein